MNAVKEIQSLVRHIALLNWLTVCQQVGGLTSVDHEGQIARLEILEYGHVVFMLQDGRTFGQVATRLKWYRAEAARALHLAYLKSETEKAA